jgi:hypothetical protein
MLACASSKFALLDLPVVGNNGDVLCKKQHSSLGLARKQAQAVRHSPLNWDLIHSYLLLRLTPKGRVSISLALSPAKATGGFFGGIPMDYRITRHAGHGESCCCGERGPMSAASDPIGLG